MADSSSPKLTKVTIQLKWVTQAQFAGYYAAKAKGYYKAERLDVTLKPGGSRTSCPSRWWPAGQAQFGVDWLPSLLAEPRPGRALVNIAQVFARISGMREIAWKNDGIKRHAGLKGKKVAVWFGGNEFELLRTLEKQRSNRRQGRHPRAAAVRHECVPEQELDAASAMTYNSNT